MPAKKSSTTDKWTQSIPLIAAIVTVFGTFGIVSYQSKVAMRSFQTAVKEFGETVRNSADLRRAVVRPLEGRWDYAVEWDVYFNVPSNPDERGEQFYSSGIADIHWGSGFYQVLLGYENGSRSGERYVVSVNTGSFSASTDGLPAVGTRIDMGYSHRLGRDDVLIGDKTIDYSDKPEDRYHYVIERLEMAPDGRITKIHASIELDTSKGIVTFSRIH